MKTHAKLPIKKARESDGKRESMLRNMLNLKKHWPTVVALIALSVSITALVMDSIHYDRLTKPHTELEDANIKLSLLEKQMDLLRIYVHSQGLSQRAIDGEEIINQAEHLRNGALSAIIRDDVSRAVMLITSASELIDKYLPHEASIQPGTVSVTATPFQGWVDIDITENTTATSKEGAPVKAITITANGVPSDASKDYISVFAVELSPTGTVFSSPVTLRFSYLASNIPEGVAEDDLVLGTWDFNTNRWTMLPSHIDLESRTITTSINHLTLFAVLAPRPK